MKTVTNNVKEKAIIKIISDFIIWHRVNKGVETMLNAFNPSEYTYDFDTDHKFHGYTIAWDLMGVSDEPMRNGVELGMNLHDVLNEAMKSQEPANVIAERIYIDWLVEIRAYYTQKEEKNEIIA